MNFYPHQATDFNGAAKISGLPMVYALATKDLDYIKIGRTASPKQRFINIQSGCPFEISLWMAIRTPVPAAVEKALHDKLKHCRSRGEWFTPSPDDLDCLTDFFRCTNASVKEAARALL